MPDEPSVTTPGGTSDEATVALTTPAEDEATIALSAPVEVTLSAPAEVALPATAEEDEATVTLLAAPMEDEATVALPAAPEEDEATVPLLANPVEDEATVALPAAALAEIKALAEDKAPVEDEAPPEQEASPEDEATAVMAAAETREPATAGPPGAVLTRRRLLLGLSGAAGVALTVGAVAVHSATTESGKTPGKPIPARPAVTRSRTPESATVTPSPVPVQRKPISTLAEYTKATGAPAFPADTVALTIDDGPHPVWTPKILQLLDKYDVPAMFCMIGNQVLGHEAIAQLVTGAGHQLANHTWSHPTKLAGKPAGFVQKEIHKAQTKINRTTGYVPKLFRSPGGDWSPKLLHGVAQAGLLPLDWSNDPRDWTRPGADKIEHRMLAARPGQILLCHDGGGDRSQTYKALSVVLPALKARGLSFVAL